MDLYYSNLIMLRKYPTNFLNMIKTLCKTPIDIDAINQSKHYWIIESLIYVINYTRHDIAYSVSKPVDLQVIQVHHLKKKNKDTQIFEVYRELLAIQY